MSPIPIYNIHYILQHSYMQKLCQRIREDKNEKRKAAAHPHVIGKIITRSIFLSDANDLND